MALRPGVRPISLGALRPPAVKVTGAPRPKFRLRKKRVAPAPASAPITPLRFLRKKKLPPQAAQAAAPEPQFTPQEAPQEAPQEQPQEQPQEEAQQEQPQEEAQQEQPQEEVQQEQPQEEAQQEETQEEEPSMVGSEVSFPLKSSHIRGNKMHTVAICMTRHGISLVHCRTKCPPKRGKNKTRIGLENVVQKHQEILVEKGMADKQKQYAGQLVERAREGDQNAMAIIALVRDNSKRGVPRACQSYKLLEQYINKNPVGSKIGYEPKYHFELNTANRFLPDDDIVSESGYRAAFGNDDKRYMSSLMDVGSEDYWSSIMLANGQPLNNRKVTRVLNSFGSEEDQQAFMSGMLKWRKEHEDEHKKISVQLNELQQKIAELGKIVGRARGLQVLRMPHSRISKFSKKVAWELGE